MKKEASESD